MSARKSTMVSSSEAPELPDLAEALFDISRGNALPIANALSTMYGPGAMSIALWYAESQADAGNAEAGDTWTRVARLLNHMQITKQRGVIYSPKKRPMAS